MRSADFNPELPEVVRDLLAAREVLRERGHCKGWFVVESGAVCAAGAINVAQGRPPTHVGDGQRAYDIVEMVTGDRNSISDWNDNLSRTQADVEAAFLDAASVALSEASR